MYGTLLANAVLDGHFKAVFEDYTAGLEYSQVYTLEELVEFNRKHSETELPPRQCFTIDKQVSLY